MQSTHVGFVEEPESLGMAPVRPPQVPVQPRMGRSPADPQSPEEAVIMLVMQAGRRLRGRHPEDEVDPSTFPLAKRLMCHDATRVSDLATQLGLDASTVSRQIKQLEDKGMVERTADPADGRASLVRISAAGDEAMRLAFRRRFERITLALEPWTERDRAQLQELLTRLARDLAQANDREAAEHDDARSRSTHAHPASQPETKAQR